MGKAGASSESSRDKAMEHTEETLDDALVALIEAHRSQVKAVKECRDCIRAFLRLREEVRT